MEHGTDKMDQDESFDLSPEEENTQIQHRCDICCYSTTDRSNFNKHKKRHNARKSVTSNRPSCSSTPKAPEKSKPDKATTQLCSHCGLTFKSKFGLSLHIKNKHTMKFKHTCQICNKGFNQTIQYRYHCSSHFQVALDKCSFCKSEFTSHGSLKRHLQTCNNVKPDTFVCEVCQTSFPHKYSLADHMKGKHQEPRYICEMCGKKFSWRSSLKAHMKHSHVQEHFE